MQNKSNLLRNDLLARIETLTQEVSQGNYHNDATWKSLITSRHALKEFYPLNDYIDIKNTILTFVNTAENTILLHEGKKLNVDSTNDYINALVFMGMLLQDGSYLEQDHKKAIEFFERAIDLGSAHAMYYRAWMHEEGIGADIDYPKAIALYNQASALGNTSATQHLKTMRHTIPSNQQAQDNAPLFLSFFFQYPCTLSIITLISITIVSLAILNGFPVTGIAIAAAAGLTLFCNKKQVEEQCVFLGNPFNLQI